MDEWQTELPWAGIELAQQIKFSGIGELDRAAQLISVRNDVDTEPKL
jgi:hypothetical protein